MDPIMRAASKNPISMAMEFYSMKIKLWCILESGSMVNHMEKVNKYMKMGQHIEGSSKVENGMVMENINGKMVVFIMASSTKELCMEMAVFLIVGEKSFIREYFQKIKKKVKDSLKPCMAHTRVNSKTIR